MRKQAKEGFDLKNGELCVNATKANSYANILMPILNNIGFILYVVVAIVGGALAISGVTNISLDRCQRTDTWCHRIFPAVIKKLCKPDQSGFPAVKLRCYGHCRCRAYF